MITLRARSGWRDASARCCSWTGLDELVYLAETEGVVSEEVSRLELSDRGVVATADCYLDSPRHLVKGATYHRLSFERIPRGFRATVVLDV